MLKNYKKLKVWQKAYEFCLEIYRIIKRTREIERMYKPLIRSINKPLGPSAP
jgi:hypothetical protein